MQDVDALLDDLGVCLIAVVVGWRCVWLDVEELLPVSWVAPLVICGAFGLKVAVCAG